MLKSNRLKSQGIENMKSTGADKWISDDEGARGGGRLVLRIGKTGSKLFYFRYSINGERKQIPIGPFTHKMQPGKVTLLEAREVARSYSAMHRNPLTQDVAATLQAQADARVEALRAADERQTLERAKVEHASKFTLKALCEKYVDHLSEAKKQSASSVKSQLSLHVYTTEWADLPAKSFTARQATALMRKLIEKDKGRSAKSVRSYLQSAFNLAIRSELDPTVSSDLIAFDIEANPISATSPLSQFSKPRERSLSDKEMGEVWRRVWAGGDDVPLVIRALRMSILLGGQRGLQLMRVRIIEDIDLENGIITIYDPKGRRLTPRSHNLPVVGKALTEVETLISRSQALGSNLLFQGSTNQLGADAMSALVNDYYVDMMEQKITEQHFQFSDLRRTAETMLAQLGIHKDIRAQLQSHGLSGIQTRHYDKYEYMEEKRNALIAWHAHLDSIAFGIKAKSNVTNLKHA